MAASLPTADDIIAVVQTLITDLGLDAFKTNGRVQFYSGPREVILCAMTYYTRNHLRAFADAGRLATTRIDDTQVGTKLNCYEDNKNIYKFFEKYYAPYGLSGFEHADKVMRYASREFVKVAYGFAATTVCGAGLNKIFFEVELPEIAINDKIKTINGIPAQMVRDFYAFDPYEAFRLICISELLETRRYARSSGSPDVQKDYQERRRFFVLERQDTARFLPVVAPSIKADIKLRKRQILASYSLAAHSAAIAGSGAPAPAAPIGISTKKIAGTKPAPV